MPYKNVDFKTRDIEKYKSSEKSDQAPRSFLSSPSAPPPAPSTRPIASASKA